MAWLKIKGKGKGKGQARNVGIIHSRHCALIATGYAAFGFD